MKHKKLLIILGALIVAIFAAVLAFTLIPQDSPTEPIESSEQIEESQKEISIPDISDESKDESSTVDEVPSESNPEDSEPEESIPPEIKDVDSDDIVTPEEPVEETSEEPSQKAEPATEPEKEKEPAKDETSSEPGKGIEIGGGDPENEEYDCGVANHHCSGPETHAYISNLELNGCPYCGSHSCPSFYATNQWGYTKYNPSICPMYNAHNDPLHYCQQCGKKVGDGSNGTCVTFNVDIKCPLCGEYVKAWECHTCK